VIVEVKYLLTFADYFGAYIYLVQTLMSMFVVNIATGIKGSNVEERYI